MDEVRIASTTRTAAWLAAEYLNQSTTTDFYTVGAISAVEQTLTQANHSRGQAPDIFSRRSETDATLFAFTLAPGEGNVTLNQVALDLSGTDGITSSLTDIRLFVDTDGTRTLTGLDTQVMGSSTVSFTAGAGTLTFDDTYTLTETTEFIIVANIPSGVPSGAELTIAPDTIDATGVVSGLTPTFSGTVASVLHRRLGSGMVVSGGVGSRIGEAPPAGDQAQSGGGGGGGTVIDENPGDQLAFTPGRYAPTTAVEGGQWTTPTNVYASDGMYTTANTPGHQQTYSVFNIDIPPGDTVTGLIVRLEASADQVGGTIEVALSWDGGSNYTNVKATQSLTVTDTIYTLGGAADDWDRTWTVTNLSNENLRLRIIAQPSGNVVRVDALQIEPVHQASGGGGGAGTPLP